MSDAIEPILDYALAARRSSIPDRVIATTKAFMLDTLALTIVGARAPGCAAVLDQLLEWGGRGEATVIVRNARLPAPAAAMANSMTAHAFDFDDTHERGDMHGYAVVLPAALAIGERQGALSGEALITALVVGIDVAYRMGLAIKHYRGWHPTATCGVFGATLAAGRIAGLDRSAMHNALGIAYSLASGNFQCILDGSLTKRLQPAFAARAATEAVILASRGITGAKNILEGKFGFYPLYEAGEYKKEPLRDRLGSWFEGEAGSMKPYPSCRFCHGAADAALEIARELELKPEAVESITVKMPTEAHDYVGGPYRPGDSPQVSAQFNMAYNVAAAIARHRLGLREFDGAAVLDPGIRALCERIETIPTDDPYGFGPQDIVLRLRDGRKIERHIAVMKGHPDNPMSSAERLAKARDCVTYAGLSAGLADRLAEWCERLDRSPNVVGELLAVTAEARA